MTIGNLTKLNSAEKAWEIIHSQNMEYLKTDWNTTAESLQKLDDLELELTKIFKSEELQEWVIEQEENYTDIYLSIQGAGTDMDGLAQVINEAGITATKQEVAIAWHILYMEP